MSHQVPQGSLKAIIKLIKHWPTFYYHYAPAIVSNVSDKKKISSPLGSITPQPLILTLHPGYPKFDVALVTLINAGKIVQMTSDPYYQSNLGLKIPDPPIKIYSLILHAAHKCLC